MTNTNDTSNFLPCPFCGAAPEAIDWPGGPMAKVFIHCPNDKYDSEDGGCSVGPDVVGSDMEHAAARWNRRAQVPDDLPPVPYNEHEKKLLKEIESRDYWEEKATELAERVGEYFGFDVGEHSNANCPVQTALEADWQPPQAAVPAGYTSANNLTHLKTGGKAAVVGKPADGYPIPLFALPCPPSPAASPEHKGDICDKCKRVYSCVHNVPNDVWAKIAPRPETLGEHNYGGGLLCPDCAATAAKEIGVHLIFTGEQWEEFPKPAKAQVPDEAFNLIEAIRAELTWPGWRKTSSRDWVMDMVSELLSMLTASPAPEHSGDGNEMVGWISVNEQTPSQGERVLLKIDLEDCPVVGYWGCGRYEACTVNMEVSCGAFCYGGNVDGSFSGEDVTHWMPLPNPPQQEEAER